ncbi:RNA polymerase III subunit C82 [Coemansia sp. RSA 1813]|nr:RNA polymerase III subunit C82 [Coemansia sp. RSA 1646]KAJ1773372.1 RNA polymerase III subunit C82 [Coemansia sp. RSA 1843]KAJ2091590.1 RNA polymerase III subunit C82 [Coemansia sp. RSA 986]KAJ2212377.1 RNA polymerase III subunit C82 [Coemansia sp. RSA 487]KAJ2572209.1 RNA polymerase III subunit C82 [Coemansia sp. RSA 1813]
MYIEQANLSKRLIREYYGPIVEIVAGVLIRDGRLPLGLLIKNTNLTAREVKQALVVLIQHGMVTHATSKDGGARVVAYYSANMRGVLRLQRMGLYLALVEERMGKEAVSVLRAIMASGNISIGAVKEQLGASEWSQAAQIKLDAVVGRLVRERFIVAVTPIDMITKVDKIMEAEAVELDKLAVLPTAKELVTIRHKINDMQEQEYHNATVVGIKRAADNDPAGSHASKVVVGPDGRTLVVANGHSEDPNGEQQQQQQQDTVDQTQCFRVYYDRLDVFLRNQQLINYFADKYNAGAGAIIKAMLRITEPRTKTCRDRRSDVLSAAQIVNQLPYDVPLAEAIDIGSDMFFQDLAASDTHNHGSRRANGSSLSPAKRTELAFALLEVVRSDASGIVTKVDERGGGQYQINFDRAATALRDTCLDTLVHEKFGSLHARIIRVLREKHKLDEKTIATAAMMPIAACRERLHDLSLAGFIDSFEIARTLDRNPSRMFYLWYINPQKQVRAAMQYVFKSMTNVYARLDQELVARAPLVAKTRRADVIADKSLLTDAENKELAALSETRSKLEVANVRLDGMLLIVHDVNPEYSTI